MVMRTSALISGFMLLGLGCGEFETRSIILDLRILAMRVEPPEVIIPLDFENPPDSPDDVEIPDIEVCALVADPADSRSLEYVLGACAPNEDDRCSGDPERLYAPIAEATVPDPEEADTPVSMCGTLSPSVQFFSVIQESLENDALSGFGGLQVYIELITRPQGAPLDDAQYGIKLLLLSPQIPPDRVANQNPGLDALTIELEDDEEITMPLGRCGDVEPPVVSPGVTINFVPVESPGAREDYVVPTFEGGVRMFTENLSYSWYATAGDWQREISGGPKDIAGNDPPLDSEWRAPEDIGTDSQDVPIWVVQRDERGGLTWYETCIRVQP